MNLYSYFRDEIVAALKLQANAGKLPASLDFARLTVEPPRDASHGDISTNAALVLAKDAGMKPRDIATLLATELAAMPTRGLGLTKRALNESLSNDLEAQLELEAELQREAGRTKDFVEGVRSFMEKRKPNFTGE